MKTFVLTFVKNGNCSVIIQRQSVQDIQREKSRIKSFTQYRGGELQVRTLEGIKVKKIL